MSIDLQDELARAGRAIDRASAPITAAEVIGISVPAPPPVGADPGAEPDAAVLAFAPPHRHTSRPLRIALVAGAAAAFAALLWAGFHRAEDQPPANAPDTTVAAANLKYSVRPELIDNYPVLAGDAAPQVVGTWSATTEDQGWGGFLGVPSADPNGVPNRVIEVHRFPDGWTYPSPDATVPGRVDGVREVPPADGYGSVLVFTVDGHPFTMVGDDIDLMYDVIDHIRPIDADGFTKGSYEMVGTLPGGLEILDANPRHIVPMWYPGLVDPDNDGPVSIFVQIDSPLALLHSGDTAIRAVAVGPYRGFLGRRADGHIDLAYAIAWDESVFMSTTTMTEGELLTLADELTFTDEATWRARYDVSWGGDVGDLTAPSVPATVSISASASTVADTAVTPSTSG